MINFMMHFIIIKSLSSCIVRVGRKLLSAAICQLTVLLITSSSPLLTQWSNNPNINTPISTAVSSQHYPTITSDGAGGAIITWHDYRSGTNTDIYAQRVNDSGIVQWTTDGVAISTAANSQVNPTIVSDGAGGAIITWQDNRNGTNTDIYAQNVDRYGYLCFNAPILTAVLDVPGDQGGKVTVAWERSCLDQYPNQIITYYSIWRGINPGAVTKGTYGEITKNETTLDFIPTDHSKLYRTKVLKHTGNG